MVVRSKLVRTIMNKVISRFKEKQLINAIAEAERNANGFFASVSNILRLIENNKNIRDIDKKAILESVESDLEVTLKKMQHVKATITKTANTDPHININNGRSKVKKYHN